MRGHYFVLGLTIFAALFLYGAFRYWPLAQDYVPVDATTSSNQNAKPSQRGTDKAPFVIRVLPSEEDKRKAEAEHSEKHEKAVYEHALVWSTILLAAFTFALACFTAYLWSATSDLVRDTNVAAAAQATNTKNALKVSEDAAKAAKESADATSAAANAAVVSSMPVLHPFVIGFKHPTNFNPAEVTSTKAGNHFKLEAFVVFENYGKTPAFIREVRADLFLRPDGEYPPPKFAELRDRNYNPMIAPDVKKKDALMGALDLTEDVSLSNADFVELNADGGPGKKYQRYTLLGLVVYDDFFGTQHRRKFCIKLRMRDPFKPPFQLQRGGIEYNDIERTEIPKKV